MNVEELIELSSSIVRNSNEYMELYIRYSQELFHYTPNCAGCTFKNDWANFVKKVQKLKNINLKKDIEMATTFSLRNSNQIFTIREKGKAVRRMYGYNMTEEFAKDYLTIGTKEEIAEREKEFKVLPKNKAENQATEPQTQEVLQEAIGTKEEIAKAKKTDVKK